MRTLLLCAAAFISTTAALAGELSRADVARGVGSPLYVGERSDDLPIWPVFNELEPDAGAVGYLFETMDFAPLPGFEGTPINLLVWLDRNGGFVSVELVRQHEPVFVSGFGPQPLIEFVRQYGGHTLRERITVASAYGGGRRSAGQVVLDGITRATASVNIAHQSVLTAALAVARERLGFVAPPDAHNIAAPRMDHFDKLDAEALLAGGYVQRKAFRNADVEALFAGSDGERADPEALADPDGLFAELHVAYLNAPTIGRALLGDEGYAHLLRRARDGQHLLWVASSGRYPIVDDDFVPATVPPRLTLTQNGLPIELRDADIDLPEPRLRGQFDVVRVFQVPATAGLDPASPMELSLVVSRARGQIFPIVTLREATLTYAAPPALFEYPPRPLPDWLVGWQQRAGELAAIGLALAVLAVVLARPRAVAADARRLRLFRLLFLAFTLGFIGWYAQAQLSIVHLTGAIKSLASGQGLGNFLYDPVVLLLIAFTLVTLVVWGRGTFCGWLCPFGALQEFVALAARRLRTRQRRLPPGLARALSRSRYAILAVIVAAAILAPQLGERLVEVEPFKTAITTSFVRSGPYLAWCLALLAAGAFVYKFFCRFVCPLGAALTIGGRLRRLDWLTRRSECGQPCQSCRSRCDYDAIARSGSIRYDDCFQCLDCVGIYHDPQRCAPLLLYRRKRRSFIRTAATVPAPAAAGTQAATTRASA
ncbi:MAG TPA: 4Fe-4S binding protein [Rhodocyclaceae bacterium]|nr:4Fe-4S binding protein [Rhodocyclaceae bacterium]